MQAKVPKSRIVQDFLLHFLEHSGEGPDKIKKIAIALHSLTLKTKKNWAFYLVTGIPSFKHMPMVGWTKDSHDTSGFPCRFFASQYPISSPGTATDRGPRWEDEPPRRSSVAAKGALSLYV